MQDHCHHSFPFSLPILLHSALPCSFASTLPCSFAIVLLTAGWRQASFCSQPSSNLQHTPWLEPQLELSAILGICVPCVPSGILKQAFVKRLCKKSARQDFCGGNLRSQCLQSSHGPSLKISNVEVSGIFVLVTLDHPSPILLSFIVFCKSVYPQLIPLGIQISPHIVPFSNARKLALMLKWHSLLVCLLPWSHLHQKLNSLLHMTMH